MKTNHAGTSELWIGFYKKGSGKPSKKAWAFFQAQPPGYRKIATFFVVSAKQDETRLRRLATLIEHSARGRRRGIATGKKSS